MGSKYEKRRIKLLQCNFQNKFFGLKTKIKQSQQFGQYQKCKRQQPSAAKQENKKRVQSERRGGLLYSSKATFPSHFT